jgi:uncharacterized protein
MSVRCGGCGLEYAGARGLGGLFPTPANLANPRYLYLLSEVKRFHRRAKAVLAAEVGTGPNGVGVATMSQFLAAGRFSRYFRTHFVTPMISAVWSCAPAQALDYPARYLFEFLDNHGMLSVSGSPQWRTVTGGSGRYVEQAVKQLSSVQALRLLARPSAAETAALSAIQYSLNPTVLHSDQSVLPTSPRVRSSWNYYLPSCQAAAAAVHVTYDLNRLQRLATETPYLVTLNDGGAGQSVAESLVLDRMTYEHPIFTPDSVAAQSALPQLNDGRLAFAGAYHGWGFHEDGCRSGVQAAASLGVQW